MRNSPRIIRTTLIVLTLVGGLTSSAHALPTVPGFSVDLYANVTDPVRMTFAPDGTMFLGREHAGSGGGVFAAVKLHRVSPGGGSVTEYGAAPIADPDTVLYDAAGTISGTPGAVLVGSMPSSSGAASIYAVLPDESIITVFGPSHSFGNPHEMSFDNSGRMLIGNLDYSSPSVLATSGAFPIDLISLPGRPERPIDLAIDALDNIYTRGENGIVRQYDSTGSLLDANYAALPAAAFDPGETGLIFGPGGVWGTDLYGTASGGEIWRIDSFGSATVFGTGFNHIKDLRFGPDGALYVSEFGEDRIWRLTSPVPEPSTYAMGVLGLIGLGVFSMRRKLLGPSIARVAILMLSAATVMMASAAEAGVIRFDEAGWAGWAIPGPYVDPATYYQASDGVTFTGNYYSNIGGNSNGDPGNWNLDGINGPVFLGTNAGIGSGPNVHFASPAYDVTLDVGLPGHNWTNDIIVTGFLGASIIESHTVNIASPTDPGNWDTVGFGSALDRIEVRLGAGSGFAFGIDNIVFNSTPAVPEPSTYAMAVLGLLGLGLFGWRRRAR